MIKLVKASAADAPVIAATRQLVWDQTYRGIYPDETIDSYDLAFYTDRDRRRMEEPDQHYYLFMDENRCVGYFSYGPYHYGQYKDFQVCLNNLYILDGFKGCGLGKQALSILREYCRNLGLDKFFCGCNANNHPAINFYRHMGGIAGDEARTDVPKQDQIIHFEFFLR